MNDITVKARFFVEEGINIFGTYILGNLTIDVVNNTNRIIELTSICLSIKRNFIFFKTSKDILHKNISVHIQPRENIDFNFDAKQIVENYPSNKNFTVKISSNDKIYQSEEVNIDTLKILASKKGQ